jgi:hypothetical protein
MDTTQLLLEVSRSADGRLEGRIRTDPADQWTSFSGVLELLKVLEEVLDRDESTAPRASEMEKETT